MVAVNGTKTVNCEAAVLATDPLGLKDKHKINTVVIYMINNNCNTSIVDSFLPLSCKRLIGYCYHPAAWMVSGALTQVCEFNNPKTRQHRIFKLTAYVYLLKIFYSVLPLLCMHSCDSQNKPHPEHWPGSVHERAAVVFLSTKNMHYVVLLVMHKSLYLSKSRSKSCFSSHFQLSYQNAQTYSWFPASKR